MESVVQDTRYALRALATRPGFTFAVILTLALGIGANSTLYSLINGILFKPPAGIRNPEQLIAVFTSDHSGPVYGSTSYPDLVDFQKDPVFRNSFALMPSVAAIGPIENPMRAGVDVASPNYFDVLGATPAQGRFFTPGNERGAVISTSLWRRLNSPPIGGYTLRLNGQPIPVLGVTSERFSGIMRGRTVDVWLTLGQAAEIGLLESGWETNRGSRSFMVYGRLPAGTTLAIANAAANVVAARQLQAYGDDWQDVTGNGRRVTVISESAARVPPKMRGPILGFTAVAMATVGIVLLVCCSNVAGLMLARVNGRSRELAIRASLGASGGRIVRQILTESVLLSLAGGLLGLLAALWLSDWIVALLVYAPIPLELDVSPDLRVLLFALVVTGMAALLFGLAPALRVRRPDLTAVLKGDVALLRVGSRRISLREVLVVGQLTLSLLLLIGSLLFFRSVRAATDLTPGFPIEDLVLFDLSPRPGENGILDPTAALQIKEQVAGLAGVRGVTWADNIPLSIEFTRRSVRIEGYTRAPGEDLEFGLNMIGPEYFKTTGIPLLKGREFTTADRAGAARVVIVNEAFARRFFGDRDPIGQRISPDGENWSDIVGVARTINYQTLGEEPRPYIYYPALQEQWGVTLHVRSAVSPVVLLPAVERIVKTTAPAWTARNARTYASHMNQSLLPQRIASNVFGLFGALALLLASVGLYATVALWVTQRTRDFGVRLALGASQRDLLRVVFGRGGRMVVAGMALGLLMAFGLTRFLGFMLVGISSADALSFVFAPALLFLVAFVALAAPALRIMRLDPLHALRSDR